MLVKPAEMPERMGTKLLDTKPKVGQQFDGGDNSQINFSKINNK